MRKVVIILALAVIMAVGVSMQMGVEASGGRPQAQAPTLRLDKESYQIGETIKVTFTAPSDYPADAWVGLISSSVPHGEESVNDEYDIAYFFLDNRTEGEFEFEAPRVLGSFDIRMNDSDSQGKEVASVSFEVLDREPSLALDKTEYQPGEKIVVRFSASAAYSIDAWIGIVPSEVPHGHEAVNDENDIVYQHVGGRILGEMEFTAPEEPGDYDLRMNDTDFNGKEVAYVSFKVVAQ